MTFEMNAFFNDFCDLSIGKDLGYSLAGIEKKENSPSKGVRKIEMTSLQQEITLLHV